MRIKGWFLGICAGLAGLFSCFDPPVFPVEPQIEFQQVYFSDVPVEDDTIVLTFKFKDGDGDVGLDNQEIDYPYNEMFYYQDGSGNLITYSYYGQPGFESLPPFEDPYNCINWIINPLIGSTVVEDTVYYERNPNYYNIFVQFFVKQNDGTFLEFNWLTAFRYPNCGFAYHGRLPILSKNLEKQIPLEGTIRYDLTSKGFKALFGAKTLKLRFWIQDRALNLSNISETNEFNLL